MGKGIDRTEFVRKECPACKGNGYKPVGMTEELCECCGGFGLIEKEVPYKFDGPRTQAEIDAIFKE